MDNDKLSTIIKDTEANLIRLKPSTFNSNRVNFYQMMIKDFENYEQEAERNYLVQQYRSRDQQMGPHKYGGAWNYSTPFETEASGNKGSSLLFGFLNQIKGQLDEQSQTLLKMNSSIQKLEAENSHYKEELMTAHSNVLQLSSLLDNERRKSNLSVERHLSQMQEMLCTELKRMSKEINELKLKSVHYNHPITPDFNYSEASSHNRRKSKKNSIQNDIYQDALKLYRRDKKPLTTIAASESRYPSSSSNVQTTTTTKFRGSQSVPCTSQTSLTKAQIMSLGNSSQKIPNLQRSHKRIQDKLSRLVASSSKMSTNSSDRDLDSSPNQTISSSQNLTLQSDEEDLHSDDSNFDLLDSRSIGKSEDGLGSSSAEDLMSECESYCSEKLS